MPLEHLADYTARLTGVFEKHGTTGTWYAHASVGCLHVRPILNLRLEKDVKAMRAIAEQAFAFVREYKGSHSGEHGDGLVRSEFHEPMFGSRLARAFEEVKESSTRRAFSIPARSCARRSSMTARISATGPSYRGAGRSTTRARLVGLSRRGGGFQGAVEMCNNNGACRKLGRRRDVPELSRHPRGARRDARPRQLAAACDHRPARPGRLHLRRDGGDDEALRVVQGLPPRMPDRRRHGADEDRGAGGACREARAVAARPAGRLAAALRALCGKVPWLLNMRDRMPGAAKLSEAMAGFSTRRTLPKWRGAMCSATRRPQRCRGTEARSCCSPTPSTATSSARTSTPRSRPRRRAATTFIWRSRPKIRRGRCAAAAPSSRRQGGPSAQGSRAHARGAVAFRVARHAGGRPGAELPAQLPRRGAGDDPKAEGAALAARALTFEEFLAREAKAGRLNLPLQEDRRARAAPRPLPSEGVRCARPVEAVLKLVPGLNVETIESSCCGMAGELRLRFRDDRRVAGDGRAVAVAGGAQRRRRTTSSSPTARPAATRSTTAPGARRSTSRACWR